MNSAYEQQRILALRRYGILDTAPEKVFDGITRAIANICDVPIALVSLVDTDRQWFKSATGLDVAETPRDVAFCAHAITRPDELMTVEDAGQDPRFMDNPLVTQDPSIKFYAGKPIVSPDGYALGTLCVIDRKPRQLTEQQLNALAALGETVSQILADRERIQKIALDRNNAEEALHQNIDQLKQDKVVLSNTIGITVAELSHPSAVIGSNEKITISNDDWQKYFRADKQNSSRNISVPDNLREVGEYFATASSLAGDELYKKLRLLTREGDLAEKDTLDIGLSNGKVLRMINSKDFIANPLLQIIEVP
jgi:signal transduction protein with GAF and PtsI domain